MNLTKDVSKLDYEIITNINELRKEHNFVSIKKIITEERLKQLLNDIYPEFTLPEIEKIIGTPDSTLEYRFKYLGIPLVRHHARIFSIAGKKDCSISVKNDGKVKIVNKIKLTDLLAYLIGFTLGDGNVQNYSVDVFNKDREIREPILNILEQYGTVTKEERKNGLWRLRLSSAKVANLIKDGGIREDTLDYIFNKNELARLFIAGFWDAEGSVLKQAGRKRPKFNVYLYNSNKSILYRVSSFLESRKIDYSIILVSGPHKKKRIYYYNGRQIIAKKDIYRINIHMSNVIGWINEIGLYLHHSKKSKVVDEMLHERLKIYGK